MLSGEGSGHLLGRGGVSVQLTFDCERESGEIGVADDATELALGFEHPGGGPAQAHLARFSIIDSQGFVDCSVRFKAPRMPKRVTVRVSAMPSFSEAAAPG